MMNYKPGDIVEVPFPFVDHPVKKRRPALVLSSEEFNQEQGIVVLAMITTAKRSRWKSDAPLNDWKEAGLKAPSMVRWKIFSLDSAMVFDRRGSLSQADRELIASSFKQIAAPFLLKTTTL